jgi:hypothetical protein
MKSRFGELLVLIAAIGISLFPRSAVAGTSEASRKALTRLLLGKEVKALLQLPASKEGIDIYYSRKGHRIDERGLDLEDMTKWLKEKGVGVDRDQPVPITEVRIGGDKIEVHLAGGGQGRRGSEHADDKAPGYQRAGGSRINFRYGRDLINTDLEPNAFLAFMGRILDTSEITKEADRRSVPEEFRAAVNAHDVKEGMTYELVLLSLGEPEQKKINDATDSNLSETWFYMKDGHRWLVNFSQGKVSKVQKFE